MNGRNKIKLGFAPTRRMVFSREDAIKYKHLTMKKLKEMDIEFSDIEWLNEEGLLYSPSDVDRVATAVCG